MSAEDNLLAIADCNTPEIRVWCMVRVTVGWDPAAMRDHFMYFQVDATATRVQGNPKAGQICSINERSADLDGATDTVLRKLRHALRSEEPDDEPPPTPTKKRRRRPAR